MSENSLAYHSNPVVLMELGKEKDVLREAKLCDGGDHSPFILMFD